jgi:hypothetical protein
MVIFGIPLNYDGPAQAYFLKPITINLGTLEQQSQ